MPVQITGLSEMESRGGGYLAGVTAAWIHASARRWGETWIPKYHRSLFFARHRGAVKTPGGGGFGHVPLDPKGSSLAY